MRKRIYDIIEVAEDGDRASLVYDRFMFVCIIVSIIPLCFKQSNALFSIIDKGTATIFVADYILRWSTADYKFPRSGFAAFVRYPFSMYAIVDLLSILPSFTLLNSGFKLFRLLRISKAFKALKLLRYSKSFNMIVAVMKRERSVCSRADIFCFLL